MKCQFCDEEVALRFRCSHCQGYFCVAHRHPENHQCPNLPKQKTLPYPTIESKTWFEPKTEPKQELPELRPEPQKPKHKVKTSFVAFCIILIVVGATIAYAGYNLGFSEGQDEGHSVGYEEGYVAGNLSGYQNGYDIAYVRGVKDGAGRGYNIRDPTYQEALNFKASDHTELHQYSATYTCFDFTRDFEMNAFIAGYRCGFVYIELREGAHAIVAFNTTDRGLIFIEPQSDEIVTLTIGQPYWDRTKYEPPDFDDTIISFDIIW